MTSQLGKQIITTHILTNISRSKENEIMKYFLQNHTENEAGRLVPELFLFFTKAKSFLRSKKSCLHHNFIIFQ